MKKGTVKSGYGVHDNMIIIESIEDLFEYFEQTHKIRITESMEDMLAGKPNRHIELYKIYASGTNGSMLDAMVSLEQKAMETQLKYIEEGEILIFNSKGGYYPLPKDAEINFE